MNVENGGMEDGEWRMENGRWEMGSVNVNGEIDRGEVINQVRTDSGEFSWKVFFSLEEVYSCTRYSRIK